MRGAVEAHVLSVETADDVSDPAVDLRLFGCRNLEVNPQSSPFEYRSGDLDPSEAFDVNACFGHDIPSIVGYGPQKSIMWMTTLQ